MTDLMNYDLSLSSIVEDLELPESAYLKAKKRYDDISEWLGRDDSTCSMLSPHIFPQGSFRLGAAIKPIDSSEKYDLDIACTLRSGITKRSHSQSQLKALIGIEIEAYKLARGIKEKIEEKHRCWRLDYQDDMSFHMDIVPCIPAVAEKQQRILEAMIMAGSGEDIARKVSQLSVSITDNRLSGYGDISDDWLISNPEGYAKWFEAQINKQPMWLTEAKAEVDQLPLFKRKSPLQRAIQILKRHRDQMFADDPDVKPISVIITTMAAKAYNGESNIPETLETIIQEMSRFVSANSSDVPNPVNPQENFADRWSMPECSHLRLKENFYLWVAQVRTDMEILASSNDANSIMEQAQTKFASQIDRKKLPGSLREPPATSPKVQIISTPTARPWRKP